MATSKRLLYAFHGSPSSNPIKIAILLEELGLDYGISSLSKAKREQKSAAHQKLHPNAKVPVLTDVDGVTTWESMAIAFYLTSKYDTSYKFSSSERNEMAHLTAWYSLQSTSLAPYVHLLRSADVKDLPELQEARSFFKSEVLRQLAVLNNHLANSGSGYISPSGYSLVDAAWAPYSDHYIRKDLGYKLGDFPSVKEWHERIFARPAVERAYAKLGIRHQAM